MAETLQPINPRLYNENPPDSPYPVNVQFIVPENRLTLGFNGLVRLPYHGVEEVAGGITGWAENITLHDERFEPDGWQKAMLEFKPHIVAIPYTFLTDEPGVRKLAADIRAFVGDDVKIVVGGHEASVCTQDILDDPNIDAIVIGQGSKPMQEIVSAVGEGRTSFENINNTYYRNEDGRLVPNRIEPKTEPGRNALFIPNSSLMASRPHARRDLYEKYRNMGDGIYFVDISDPYGYYDSSGCRYRCDWCTIPGFNNYRYMVEPAERTVDEIVNRLPRGKLLFNLDDLAYSHLPTLMKVVDGLLKAGIHNDFFIQTRVDVISPRDPEQRAIMRDLLDKLAQVGNHLVFLGIESLNPIELASDNKGTDPETIIRAVKTLQGVKVNGERRMRIMAALLARPHFVKSNFDELIRDIQTIAPDYLQLTILTPQPGTPAYKKARAAGDITTNNRLLYDFQHAVVPTALPLHEFYEQYVRVPQESMPIFQMLKDISRRERAGINRTGTARRIVDTFKGLTDPSNYMKGHLESGSTQIDSSSGKIFTSV